MRLAVISDIHGNFEALQQVLVDIDKSRIDNVISLGDNIGYGPEPDRVVQYIMARDIPSVQGNHELAVKDKEYLNWFNPVARRSLIMTSGLLSETSQRFVTGLEPFLTCENCRFVHGFPPDSPLIYMFQASDNRKIEVFKEIAERLCFIGHTHTLEIISYDGQAIEYDDLPEGLTNLAANKRYIINIGSVGQPRDTSNDAKYVIWDSAYDSIEVRHVPYDIAAVVKKIKAAGLPEEHAQRLW
jgi:predicted phosphodiesterase